MNNNRYILTIQNENIFKEVDVSNDTPFFKIGTLQECDIRLKRELFNVPICMTLCQKDDGWHIFDEGLRFGTKTGQDLRETVLHHGDTLMVYLLEGGEKLFHLTFSYDFTVGAIDFDTILDIRDFPKLVIGNTPNATIALDNKLIGTEYITLTHNQKGTYLLDATKAPTMATYNGMHILNNVEITEYDFFSLADYSFYFKNDVLYTTKREDMKINGIVSQPLRNETPAFNYPRLNRSPRILFVFDTDPIEILNPPQKPDRPRDNLVMQLMPAILMIAVTVLTRSGLIAGLNTGSPAFLIFSLATMSVGIFTSIISFVYNRKSYKKEVENWKQNYDTYLVNKRQEIEEERKSERNALLDLYPSVRQVRDMVKTFSGRLFERSSKDMDFLQVRVGTGEVSAFREITYRQEEHIKVENELVQFPALLQSEYALIKDAPVMLHLREAGMVGVIGNADQQYDFFKNILLDICVLHSNEDVQIILLFPQKEQKKYEWIKWLPHIKISEGGFRGIVCDDESRDNVFEYLYALMSERKACADANSGYIPSPYIVIFVLEEYNIKTHPLFKYADESAKYGVSFVFFKQYKENLPQYCREIVQLTEDGGILRLRDNQKFERKFLRDSVEDSSIQFVAERLAPVFTEKIALSSRLITNITLFELLNIISPEDLDLLVRWKKSNVQKSLEVPLGVDVKGEHIFLDLHEKAHGPHGLVAGTTGSGKSEIMQSYILSAAACFHPYEVSFVIIDFKGGGMANQFRKLPHLIGKITDIDSHEINRSLLSIRAELEKRKRLFAEYEVNHIDQYIAKFREKTAKIALPHLILIVDEFAELKAEQPEFMKELISTARVGRSLGIHLILATQKPAGQVNEQIWSNSRFKLCLKVATREDSNEVLRSPLAAEIREPGRAYLQVGNNEIFTLFQSAYSGASAVSDKNGNMHEFSISEVSFTGKKTKIYERKAEHTSDGSKITQLKVMVDYIAKYCEDAGIPCLPSICLPPLSDALDYVSPDDVQAVPEVQIGIYDDPANQMQSSVRLNFAEGNIIVIGAAQTGKTLLLQTILRGIAENYSPRQVSVYILDFASKVLSIYGTLNHVGGVVTDTDDEKLKNFFKMMLAEIDMRKEKLSKLGIGSYQAYLEQGLSQDMPWIVIMIDNLVAFKEMFPDYEDALLHICREGLALGISVVATSKQTSGLNYRYLSNFATRLAFQCTESSEYSNIFDRCPIRPRNIQGRGLVSIEKVIYEYQAYLPFDGITGVLEGETKRSESKRREQITEFIRQIAIKYGQEHARAIPSIPQVLLADYWETVGLSFGDYIVPVGLTYNEIEPVAVDLAHVGALGIYGREGFGKSNLLRGILVYLQQHVFDLPCEAYLIDGYDRQLAEFESFGYVQQQSVDCSDFEYIVQKFSDEAKEREDILRAGGKLDHLPLLLCVVQNVQIFSANVVAKEVSEQFKKLLSAAKRLKICFIFSDIDNNPEYSPPEMLRIAREFTLFFLLDDIVNVKLFGNSKFTANDIRQYKKALSLGDGYLYDARNGLEKIKLVKTERSS